MDEMIADLSHRTLEPGGRSKCSDSVYYPKAKSMKHILHYQPAPVNYFGDFCFLYLITLV